MKRNTSTPGAFQTTFMGNNSDGQRLVPAFVTKFNPAGSALVYSTFLGGAKGADATAIAVDSSGNAYVTGSTESHPFPTTPGAFQTSLSGFLDAFLTKLNADGSALIYSTYLGGGASGGADQSSASALVVDASGDAYVTGFTDSPSFPTTRGAFQTTCGICGPSHSGAAFVTVQVVDLLSGLTKFVSCTSNAGGTCANAGNTVVTNFPSIASGHSAYITVVAQLAFPVIAGGTIIENRAIIFRYIRGSQPHEQFFHR